MATHWGDCRGSHIGRGAIGSVVGELLDKGFYALGNVASPCASFPAGG